MQNKNKCIAPIVLFVYNRKWHTQQTIDALRKNVLAADSILYIFCDGYKSDSTFEEKTKVLEVREYVYNITGFKNVIIEEQNQNIGLADSVVNGVTKIIDIHGKVIVLEDDIVTTSGFLKYMNDALNTYENEERIMHITGYNYPHKTIIKKTTAFYYLPNPWGWGTWKRAWNNFNKDAQFLYNEISKNKLWRKFNSDGGNFFKTQLEANITGTLKTWFVKWHATIVLKNGLTLFPHQSLVINIGMDGSGENCGLDNSYSDNDTINEVIISKDKILSSKLQKKIVTEFYSKYNNGKNVNMFFFVKNYIRRTLKYFKRRLLS